MLTPTRKNPVTAPRDCGRVVAVKTLVTGATGFVGSAVVRQLIDAGHDVRALVRATSPRRNLEGLDVEPFEGDLADRTSLRNAVRGCRAVFHVAADYRLWVPKPDTMYQSNVAGTRDLFLAATDAGVERMVYTSSVATLGLPADGTPGDEKTPVSIHDMIGHYKRSKYLAEEEVCRLVKKHALPIVTVNPSTPIGPRDVRPTPTGRMVLDAARGAMPAYVDTGLNVAHVDDVAAGHLLAFERGRPGERYILGGTNLSLREILTEVAAIAGRRPPRVRLPHNLILPIAFVAEWWARFSHHEPLVTLDGVRLSKKRMYFSCAKAREQLGYVTRPPREALADAIGWFAEAKYLKN